MAVQFTRKDADGSVKARIPYMHGKAEGGTGELRITASAPFDLLSATCVYNFMGSNSRSSFKMKIDGWRNNPILDLPLVDDIYEMFFGASKNDTILVELLKDNQHHFSHTSAVFDDFTDVDGYKYFVEILRIARDIARRNGLNPILPRRIDDKMMEGLNMVRHLRSGKFLDLSAEIKDLRMAIDSDERARFAGLLMTVPSSRRMLLASSWMIFWHPWYHP